MKQTTTSDPSGGTTLPWPHHPALDGLRTVAVYLVVLFHSGVSGFDGGFLGVDLFFVLSGFLVSSVLLDEAERTGRVRLGRFYGRRVRRLLPAAVVVVIATSGLSLLLSPLVARLPWIGDAQASLLYVSNWRFLEQSNEYFGADINRSPFLHFWSLSVEEQFYFALPLILLLLFKLRRRWRPALVTGVAVLAGLSVADQFYWAGRDATHAYYGTDARIYQLLVGVLAAIAWRRYQSQRVRARGSGWVFLAILLLTASSLAPFSVSWRGLLATGASVGLTLAVVARTDRSLVAALSRPTMTYLGQISYGTYLWHWPAVLAIGLLVDVPTLGVDGAGGGGRHRPRLGVVRAARDADPPLPTARAVRPLDPRGRRRVFGAGRRHRRPAHAGAQPAAHRACVGGCDRGDVREQRPAGPARHRLAEISGGPRRRHASVYDEGRDLVHLPHGWQWSARGGHR